MFRRSAAVVLVAVGMLGCDSKNDGPAEVARAKHDGVSAAATIVAGEDTHSRSGNLSYYRFTLAVRPDDAGAPFTRESSTLLNSYDAVRYPIGAQVRIRYLADNPLYFAFE